MEWLDPANGSAKDWHRFDETLRAKFIGGGVEAQDPLGDRRAFEEMPRLLAEDGMDYAEFRRSLRDEITIDQLRRIAAFFRDESCGQCVPCRVGTVRQEEAIDRLAAGVRNGDLDLLRDIGQAMKDASICGLGQTAYNAIETAIVRLGVFS